jgi:hypothetical protein
VPIDGDSEKSKIFMTQSGIVSSALEHSVPEKIFSTDEQKAEGISAVKALKIAADQGMRIYTINQSNSSTILPQLQINSDTKQDIASAVAAGKTVTVSSENIDFNGWIGCGYIAVDGETGAGSYMISGGLSGGLMATTPYDGLFLAAAAHKDHDLADILLLIFSIIAALLTIAIGIGVLVVLFGPILLETALLGAGMMIGGFELFFLISKLGLGLMFIIGGVWGFVKAIQNWLQGSNKFRRFYNYYAKNGSIYVTTDRYVARCCLA